MCRCVGQVGEPCKKRMKRSRCRLGYGLVLDWGPGSPHEKAHFSLPMRAGGRYTEHTQRYLQGGSSDAIGIVSTCYYYYYE